MAKKPVADWTVVSIDHLSLSVRARNVLVHCQIKTIGELSAKSDNDLRRLPGMGTGSLQECRAAVRDYLTDRGHMGDVALALRRAAREAGVNITPSQTLDAVNALANDGWSISRV